MVATSDPGDSVHRQNKITTIKVTMEKIDMLHRRHLRTILNIKGWPNGQISNIALYSRCNVTKLSERIHYQRWKMFGHILRSGENTPAQISLLFAIESENRLKGRLGRPRLNLFALLLNDLKDRNMKMKNIDDLYELRDVAKSNKAWENLYWGTDY